MLERATRATFYPSMICLAHPVLEVTWYPKPDSACGGPVFIGGAARPWRSYYDFGRGEHATLAWMTWEGYRRRPNLMTDRLAA